MTKRYALEAAYHQGLREMNGMDPDVARDLGFITNPDEFDAVRDSHKHVSPLIEAREAAHQANVRDYHLQTDEQRDYRQTGDELAEIDSQRLAAHKSLGHTVLGA